MEQVDYVLSRFGGKLGDIFGDSVEPRRLLSITRENGMVGFILEVFSAINDEQSSQTMTAGASRSSGLGGGWQTVSRSPQMQSINRSFEEQLGECGNLQNLKDVMQEFMELMYNQMER